MTGGAAGAAGTDAGRAPNAGGTDARGGATGSGTGGGAAAGSGGSGGTGGSNQPDGGSGADARDGAVTFIDGPRRDTALNPGAKVPAQFLDLSNWKITLPIGNAEEIKQPQLATYQMPPIFWMDP